MLQDLLYSSTIKWKFVSKFISVFVWWPPQKHAKYCRLGSSVYILAKLFQAAGAVLISSCCVKTEAHLGKLATICLTSQFSTLCSVNSSATFLWRYVARILFSNSYSAVPKKQNLVGCYCYIVLYFVLIIYYSEKRKLRIPKFVLSSLDLQFSCTSCWYIIATVWFVLLNGISWTYSVSLSFTLICYFISIHVACLKS